MFLVCVIFSRRHCGNSCTDLRRHRLEPSSEAGNVDKTQEDTLAESSIASPEAENVEKTQKDIPMEPPQASPEAGNVEKTSGRRTSCVVRQRYQLCGQAKAALRFQRHTCLCRAARITNPVGQENHLRHQPQPYKQFSTYLTSQPASSAQ